MKLFNKSTILIAVIAALSCTVQANAGQRQSYKNDPVAVQYEKDCKAEHGKFSVLSNGNLKCDNPRHPVTARAAGKPAKAYGPAPAAGVENPKHAEQLVACNQQAEKRRALGIDSKVVWDNPFTCRATGGIVEVGRL